LIATTEQKESGDEASLVRLADLLTEGDGRSLRLIRSGVEAELPRSVRKVLTRVAEALASGRGVAVLPVDRELTTREAADLLVSLARH
jgi:hypothetical protein